MNIPIDDRRAKIGNKRPRYFAGQYLLADDFQLEQDYHIDRQWRQNRLLHVSGIAEGLEVEIINDTSLRVKEGTAIDSEGRLIVQYDKILTLNDLHEDGENIPKEEYALCIQYQEEAAETQQGTESPESFKRWHEKPSITLEKGAGKGIALAKVTVDAKGKMKKKLIYNVRKYSGIRLPSGPKGTNIDKWPTLRATESGQMELKGDLTFGSACRQMINLYADNTGIGVQSYTQYFRTGKNFAWYKGGKHVNGELDAGGGTPQMVIKDGNVGIGTIDPKTKLHITGGTDAELAKGGFLMIGTEDGANLIVDDNEIMARKNGQNSALHLQADGGGLDIHNNKTNELKFVVADSGNVGIGTTDPKAKLSIEMPKDKGDEKVQGISIKLGVESTGNPIEVLKNGDKIFYVDNNGTVYAKSSNIEKID